MSAKEAAAQTAAIVAAALDPNPRAKGISEDMVMNARLSVSCSSGQLALITLLTRLSEPVGNCWAIGPTSFNIGCD